MKMCKSILESLYFGKIRPWERKIEKTVESKQLEGEIQVEKDFLRGQLSVEAYSRLETLESLYTESSELESVDSFENGFKIGAIIMLEILTSLESIVTE